jgi:hypothetical protein
MAEITAKKEMVECMRVCARFTERQRRFEAPDFGKKVSYPKEKFDRDTEGKFKMLLGKQGFMSVEDYEKGLFSLYGIDGDKVAKATENEQIKKANDALQQKVLELESQLKNKSTKTEA